MKNSIVQRLHSKKTVRLLCFNFLMQCLDLVSIRSLFSSIFAPFEFNLRFFPSQKGAARCFLLQQRLLMCYHKHFLEMPKKWVYCYAITLSQSHFWFCDRSFAIRRSLTPQLSHYHIKNENGMVIFSRLCPQCIEWQVGLGQESQEKK